MNELQALDSRVERLLLLDLDCCAEERESALEPTLCMFTAFPYPASHFQSFISSLSFLNQHTAVYLCTVNLSSTTGATVKESATAPATPQIKADSS